MNSLPQLKQFLVRVASVGLSFQKVLTLLPSVWFLLILCPEVEFYYHFSDFTFQTSGDIFGCFNLQGSYQHGIYRCMPTQYQRLLHYHTSHSIYTTNWSTKSFAGLEICQIYDFPKICAILLQCFVVHLVFALHLIFSRTILYIAGSTSSLELL